MEWTRGPLLGRGSTATVSAATSSSGDLFAVKSADIRHSKSLQKEQHFLSILKSPYVVGYKGCDITTPDNNNSNSNSISNNNSNGNSEKTVYNVFMEYMSGGSVINMINRRKSKGLNGLTDTEIATYTRHVIQGLEYIHSNGIVHCDIKCHNILINEHGAKIGDFGCAKWAYMAQPESSICGTPMFMAPEVARGEEQGRPADVWAVGCTIIEMATGRLPWPHVDDPVSLLYKIGFSDEVPVIPDWFSDEATDFVSKCLVRDPRRRWTAAELVNHPYVNQLGDDSNRIISEKNKTDSQYSPTSVLDAGTRQRL